MYSTSALGVGSDVQEEVVLGGVPSKLRAGEVGILQREGHLEVTVKVWGGVLGLEGES